MNLATLLVILLLVVLLLGVVPAWPHSRAYGYGPSGIIALILIVVLILILTGRL